MTFRLRRCSSTTKLKEPDLSTATRKRVCLTGEDNLSEDAS